MGKMVFSLNDRRSLPWGTLSLVALFLGWMGVLGCYDYEWTLFFHQHRHRALGDFTRRTLFEGGSLGASDPAIFFLLVVFVLYFFSRTGEPQGWLSRYRPYFGYVVFNAFVTGLGLVHINKWMLGRARPYLVLDGEMPYSDWFEWGPHFVTEGIFFGSFPSGHTAAVFLLLTLSYILVSDPDHSRKLKAAGLIWGGLSLGYTSLMIVGRSMTLHHWLSDSVGIAILCWISLHVTFFYVLKIPQQVSYVRRTGYYPPLPRYWEFQLLWRLFFIALSVMGMVFGLRAVLLSDGIWLMALWIPAFPVCLLLVGSLKRVYRSTVASFSG